MTWYTVEHACGDSERHRITGSNAASRDRRAEGLRATDCSACQQRQRETDKAERNAAAAAAAIEQGLPELVGTERQIPWATTIRADALAILDEMVSFLDDKDETAGTSAHRVAAERKALECYRRIYLATTQAKPWIDFRDWISRPAELARRFATENQHKTELAELEAQPYKMTMLASLALSRRNARGHQPS